MSEEYEIPEGVEFKKEGDALVAKGERGEVSKVLKHPKIKISVKGNKVIFSLNSEKRKVTAILGTWKSILRNMSVGVSKGYEAEVKLVHSHFPAKIELKENTLLIQNFLGERRARIAKLPDGVEVKTDKNIIKITGLDKELVSQTGSRIEKATKVSGFDRRVFQDGCYMVKRATAIGD